MKKILFVTLCFFFQFQFAYPQLIQSTFNTAFLRFVNDKDYKHASIGLLVIDLKTGKTIAAHNSQMGLAPASTQKIITAATAYHLLGEGFKYETRIGYTGSIENGKLKGNIIIKGSGDPTLGSWRYAKTKEQDVINNIVSAIRKEGIDEIDGNVLIDDGIFDDDVIPDGWIWQDIGNYYGGGARSLNWRENQYELLLKSGSTLGSPVDIAGTNPSYVSGLHLQSKLKAAAAGTGDNAYIYLPLFTGKGYVRGTIPVSQNRFSISGTMPDPGRQLAITIESVLKRKPVEEIEKAYPADPHPDFNGTKDIQIIESPALDSISYWFLQKSINLYGEALLKTLGMRFGKAGSTSEGIRVTKDFWKKQGIDNYALNMIDGSGLSPQNRVTVDDLVSVLLFAKKQPWFDAYFAGFPVYNGIKMKSGTISKVLGYTGFVSGKSGDFVFAFIINNYNGSSGQTRKKMWQLLDILK